MIRFYDQEGVEIDAFEEPEKLDVSSSLVQFDGEATPRISNELTEQELVTLSAYLYYLGQDSVRIAQLFERAKSIFAGYAKDVTVGDIVSGRATKLEALPPLEVNE